MMRGAMLAQTHNLNSKGRPRTWKDFFPLATGSNSERKVTDSQAIEMFQAYNTMRGYKLNGG